MSNFTPQLSSAELDYPIISPSLDLNFANTKTLDPRISFIRNSSATYVDAQGIIRTAGPNQPRFDHNPETGESLGLLMEESRTNYSRYSQDISTTSWIRERCTVTPNYDIAPDGSKTAGKADFSGANNQRMRLENYAGAGDVTSNTLCTISIFVKLITNNTPWIGLVFQNKTSSGVYINFNIKTKSIGNVGSGVNTPRIQSYPNGWFRLSFTSNSLSGGSALYIQLVALSNNQVLNINTVTAPASSILVWGPQLEQGANLTSYIPTQASAVTRSSDVASMTGTNFTNWYNQNEGTFVTQAKYDSTPIKDQTVAVVYSVYNFLIGVIWQGIGYDAGIYPMLSVVDLLYEYPVNIVSNYNIDVGTSTKVTTSYKKNKFLFCQDGKQIKRVINIDTLRLKTPDTKFNIGAISVINSVNTWILNGRIAQITYYPKQLSESQIRTLSL